MLSSLSWAGLVVSGHASPLCLVLMLKSLQGCLPTASAAGMGLVSALGEGDESPCPRTVLCSYLTVQSCSKQAGPKTYHSQVWGRGVGGRLTFGLCILSSLGNPAENPGH